MFHDAPVEAVVVPHRRPRRQAEAADLQKRITTQYQLTRVVDYLVDAEAPFLRVALQFPDEMLEDATLVSHTLSTLLQQDPRFPAMQAKLDAAAAAAADTSSASTTQCCSGGCKSSAAPTVVTARRSQPVVIPNPNAPNTTRLVILADTTFGSCCPDEITAQHYQCDCIIHFGEACMSKSTRLPVLYIHPHFEIQAVQQEPSLSDAEKISAALVCRVVKRVTDALLKRQQHADAAGIVPRLVVVGPHSAGKILQGAEALWTLGTSASSSSIGVDWGKQECRDGGCSSSNPQVDAAHQGKGEGNDEDASTWIINGVRFPRLAPSETAVVQYFLFVGPSASQHLVHILGVHEHNRFHYTDEQADFFTMDSGDDDDDVLMLSILSETFGLSSSEEDEAAARHRISAVEEVDAFVATALSGGLSSLYSSALAGAQLRLQKRMRQRGFNIEAVRASSAIGILVASLAIEGYYETTMLLHQLLRAYGKRSYIIYVGHLNEFKLANFVDTVDCFVAIACPNSRSSHFPDRDDGYMKPVVNPAEVLLALTADDATSKQYGIPAIYSTVFDFILPPLRSALAERLAQVEEDKKNNTTGSGREGGPSWNESAALIQMSSAGGGVLTVEGSAQGALARLHERSYVGLNPEVGQTPVQTEIADGKHGIARGYATERAEQSKQ